MSLNVLSLFAGIGGLDLGLERAGMTVIGQVEIDPYCQRVLAKHWPEVPRHDDVRTAVAWWLGRTRPPVHVVTGGFPCQPVSVAGRRRAQEDERWLWPATRDVIRDLRPRYAIMENVPGLLARGMGDVLADLAQIGYDAEWDCIPAAAVGAPHRRDRVFVVAYPTGGRCMADQRRHLGGSTGAAAATREPERVAAEVIRLAGQGGPVADAVRQGLERPRPAGTASDRAALANPNGFGRDRRRSTLVGYAGHPDHRGPRARWRTPTRDPWWASEPDVGRVAHGIPNRVDRLRALGNAVVPQVAEHIGRLITALDLSLEEAS